MINISDSKPKEKFTLTPKPNFRTDLERQRWWQGEREKWEHGFGSLSGMHYFYLTQCYIKSGTAGAHIRPKYRDCDEWIINSLHDSYWNCKGAIGLVKRRELGATSIGAGLLPMYSMRMFTGSTFGMTSCDQPRISKAFSDKTTVCLNEMDKEIAPVIERKNETKNATYLKLAWNTVRDGKTITQFSDFYSKETADSDSAAKGFSGTRMRAAYFDEFPLHRRKKQLLSSSLPCFMEGMEQTGFLLWSGTVEDGITNEQIFELQQLVNDAAFLNTKIIFAPAWWGLKMNGSGESDEKAGTEWVMKERERYDKLEDKSFLKAFIKNYPLTLDEIFEIGNSARFEDDVAEKIKEQYKIVISEKQPIQKCNIIDMGSEVKKVFTEKGFTEILEDPRPNVSYYLNIDGVATGTKAGSETGSNVAGTIVKMFDTNGLIYAPVSIYSERPKTIEQSYISLVALAKYYNQHGGLAGIMSEANAANADHFSTFLEKVGMGKYIINRQDLSGKGNSNTKKLFQYVTIDVRDFQMRQANIFLRKYISNIRMIPLLKDMMKSTSENADVLDSWLMFFTTPGGRNYDKPAKAPAPKQKRQKQILTRDENGRTTVKWVTE